MSTIGPRQDELLFRKAIADKVRSGGGAYARQIAKDLGMNEKRAWYLCDKWDRKGWWEYGVNALAGWLTEDGRRAFGLDDV